MAGRALPPRRGRKEAAERIRTQALGETPAVNLHLAPVPPDDAEIQFPQEDTAVRISVSNVYPAGFKNPHVLSPWPNSPNSCEQNQLARIECAPDCGDDCENSHLQKQEKWAKCRVKETGYAGNGLHACEDVKRGQTIGPYAGKIILGSHIRSGDKYNMKLDENLYINAEHIGYLTRYMNHRCINPNCHTERRFVKGLEQVGLFASKDIQAGEELTFDYGCTARDDTFTCKCADCTSQAP